MVPPLNCLQRLDGLYYDLEYCNVYWECRSGRGKKYECPIDYAYHHIDKRCDFIENVDCSRAEVNPVETTSNTTSTGAAEVVATATTSSTNITINSNETIGSNSNNTNIDSNTTVVDANMTTNVFGASNCYFYF